MKESKLLEMQNKVEALGNVPLRLVQELKHLKDLSVGTMELVKKFPGYKKALDKLKEDYKKQNESIQTKDTV
jgi:predicted ATP-grasp superfamily ATP-dependent carboligase